jgi:hypothetical protein
MEHLQISDTSGQKKPLITVEAQFNPTEMSITRGANYAEVAVPGLRQPLLQFVRGETQVLTAELFFDGTDTQTSVTDKTADPSTPSLTAPLTGVSTQDKRRDLSALRAYSEIASDLHAPPVCTVRWGDKLAFTGVVTSLTEKFVMFGENGEVLRARVTLTVKSYVAAGTQAQTTSSQSPDRFKTRVVKEGDRIDLIASEEYGDPGLWTTLAKANDLARPRVLRVGSVLQIPPL